MNKIVVICGPTAVGKTEIALKIAGDFDMEIVSCDSMQIYKYMDIGSAKPSPKEMELIPHHMIDVVDPTSVSSNAVDSFSVAKYSEMAQNAIDQIISRGKIPLITGGTGLYLDSIIYDIDFASSPEDSEVRRELYDFAEEKGAEALHKILQNEDPESAERIHPNNIKRVVRAIESARLGNSIKDFKSDFTLNSKYNPILIGLTRERQELYDRINKRVDLLMEKGLLKEVTLLKEMGLTSEDYPMKGIGYKELLDYLDGKVSLDEAVDQIKTNTRHYAKRQFTWFKKYEDMTWFDLTGIGNKGLYKDDDSYLGYDHKAGEIKEWLKTKL